MRVFSNLSPLDNQDTESGIQRPSWKLRQTIHFTQWRPSMPEADSELDNQSEVIKNRTFDELIIKRVESDCYLIVMTCGKAKVYADRHGKHKIYRHAWQIRIWLSSTFGIPPESVRVETIIP